MVDHSKNPDIIWEELNKILASAKKITSPTKRQAPTNTKQKAPTNLFGGLVGKNGSVTTSDLPWNSEFTSHLAHLNEASYYMFKETEHTGRVVFGDPKALAYEKLARLTEDLNKHLRKRYPNLHYTTEDVYSVAKSHTAPWGQASYLGHKDAFRDCAIGPNLWNIMGELGNFNPSRYGKLPNILVGDTEKGTGRSKKGIIAYCQALMENPNKWITIKDHHGGHTVNTDIATRIQEVMHVLNLKTERHLYKNNMTGELSVDLKLCLAGSPLDNRINNICSPRTLSTPETSPKS